MKFKIFLILSGLVGVTYADVCSLDRKTSLSNKVPSLFNGSTTCKEGKVDSILINGALELNKTTIQKLKVNGNVIANSGEIGNALINGNIEIADSKSDSIKVNGALSAQKTVFENVEVNGISKFTGSTINKDLTVKRNPNSTHKLETYLYENTIINGNIIFENGEGIVYKSDKSIIRGKVLNGKIVNI